MVEECADSGRDDNKRHEHNQKLVFSLQGSIQIIPGRTSTQLVAYIGEVLVPHNMFISTVEDSWAEILMQGQQL